MTKKLITLLLSLTIVFCAGTPVFAGETQSEPVQSAAQTGATAEVESDERADDSVTGEDTRTEEEIKAEEEAKKQAEEEAKKKAEEEAKKKAEAEAAAKKKAEAAKKAAQQKALKYKKGLAAYIRTKNGNLSKAWTLTLAGYFIDAGKKYDLDPKILMAIAQRESTFRAKATSPYGIKGMMQTSDHLARQYGYKPSSLYKAKVSIDVGARYLASMKKKFGNYTKALSGYVYGSYAVSKGNYSTSHAKAMLKTRKQITNYLKKHKYI